MELDKSHLTWGLGIAASVMAILLAWDKVGLPVPATQEQVKEAIAEQNDVYLDLLTEWSEYAKETRNLALAVTLSSLEQRLVRLNEQIALRPNDAPELQAARRTTESQMHDIEAQMSSLRGR